MNLLIHDARVLTLAGPAVRRGAELAESGAWPRGWVRVEDGLIAALGEGDPPDSAGAERLDAGGRVLMPGFVDAHTHACWAGDRLSEWELKRRGASYLDILKAGGGIMSTVRAVRAASEDELVDGLLDRLDAMAAEGTTSVEVKSGYGLTTADELKMLRAIRRAGEGQPLTVVPTACIGHAIEQGVDRFVERTIEETLPAVSEEFPGIALDAYCEDGAWSLDDTVSLFEAAAALGHPLRVHADQFNALGMTAWARANGVLSIDHLEATDPEELAKIAASDCYGVMLPCSGFHVDARYADGRAFLDAGGRLVLATNCNPGSSPSLSMPMAIALAVRNLGISAAEAIAASTVNAAALLGLSDRGRIEEGFRADLVLLRHRDERQLGYEFGGSHALAVLCGGEILRCG